MNEEVSDAGAQDRQFLELCRLLNEHDVHYLLCGGYACILHGNLRTTQDVDLLIEETSENYQRILKDLSQFGDKSAAELTEADLVENLVVKINDVITIDVSRRAWTVTYEEAIPNAIFEEFDGIQVPYLGIQDLIRSKQTYRDKDRLDIQMLMANGSASPQHLAGTKGGEKSGCIGVTGLLVLGAILFWMKV